MSDSKLDELMIQKGWELNSNSWKYNAITHSSLHYSNEILNAGGQNLDGMNIPIPTHVFNINKAKYTQTNNKKSSDSYLVTRGDGTKVRRTNIGRGFYDTPAK